ncbi:hypothetical protein [Acidiluteibacter ferrifornacis]|uniref:DUF3857 domain-containing protein n=1 Tax=Acidiluteibacter ferrifornacis TaxID=2692424 RepID=A0A6N9NQ80_9FLAO|nr:hypothetical protein [Acidiluteibacter ferrifornacis]NBG67450.1 hypothetical protein [Acidiluteibacter ferrifornacis]
MKRIQFSILVVLAVCLTTPLFSTSLSETFILKEENRIDVVGKKSNFITISITKKVRIKINDLKGVERFSKISLPETFDPTYFAHFSKIRNYQYALSEVKILSFSANKITKSGVKLPINYKDKYRAIVMERGDDQAGGYDLWDYTTTEINIGDEIEIVYSYTVPFDINFYNFISFRIFFHKNIDIKEYTLELAHHPSLNINVEEKNGASPDSIYELENQYTYRWSRKNLKGCIDEVGGRAYTQLPFIVMAILPIDLYYKVPDSFKEKYIPTYAFFASRRENAHMTTKMSIDQGLRTADLGKLYSYIDSHSSKFPDDENGYQSLKSIHTDITDRFTYDNDKESLFGIDNRKDRLGAFIDQGVVREINRYSNYVAITRKLGLHYFTSYLCDVRTGELSGNFYTPMLHSDYLIAVVLKDYHLQYIYPKNSNFGYYINEIPFYFENAKSRLIQPLDYLVVNRQIEEEAKEVRIFSSTENENIRRANVLVKVDLDKSSLAFQAKIDLTGQFSTITRGIYQKNVKNQYVNKIYNEKLWSFDKDIEVQSEKFVMKDNQFPFQANINAQYSGAHLMKKDGDDYTINMKNWFNHVIYENFQAKDRQLDFYADFKSKDSYVYYFQFSKDVQLTSVESNVNIENEYGIYNFSVTQINPTTIKVSSFYEVNSTSIAASKTKMVEDIFTAIEKSNLMELRFQ